MPRSLIERYIVSLADANLSEPIVYLADTLSSIEDYLRRAGTWQDAPDGGGKILLSESASVYVYVDSPPWYADDDLARRIEDALPHYFIYPGPRGGIRRERIH
jgi:hypothetical protein